MTENVFRLPDGKARAIGPSSDTFASRERIIQRARELLKAGTLRPTKPELCTGIITDIAVSRHFPTMTELYRQALADEETRTIVLARVMPDGPWPSSGDCDRLLEAILTGRAP